MVLTQKILIPKTIEQRAKEEVESNKEWYWNQVEANCRIRARQRDLRLRVLEMLGDKCVRCGFTDKRALEIDHIHGGGGKELRRYSSSVYKQYLLRKGEGLQLLCANCNRIKKHERHEFRKRKYPVEGLKG